MDSLGARRPVGHSGYIVEDNPDAAQRLKDDIEAKAATLPENPKAYHRPGWAPGSREMVVWSNYIIVYSHDVVTVRILRVLHSAQQWPPGPQ